jgi:hypothetical protein
MGSRRKLISFDQISDQGKPTNRVNLSCHWLLCNFTKKKKKRATCIVSCNKCFLEASTFEKGGIIFFCLGKYSIP